jgi:hypothetical protein
MRRVGLNGLPSLGPVELVEIEFLSPVPPESTVKAEVRDAD